MSGWRRPVVGPVGTRFGVAGSLWSSGHHTGQDFPVPLGTRVQACAPGRVIYAGNTHGPYGWQVKVAHGNGLETWYCHLSTVSTSRGVNLPAGGLVGFSGASGNVTGPHLHLEVRRDGVAVDPLPYLDGKKGPPPKDDAPEPDAAYPGQAPPYPDWSTKAQPAGLFGIPEPADVLAEARDLTLTGLVILAGFGLVAVGAVVAALPKIKATAADAVDNLETAAALTPQGAAVKAATTATKASTA